MLFKWQKLDTFFILETILEKIWTITQETQTILYKNSRSLGNRDFCLGSATKNVLF